MAPIQKKHFIVLFKRAFGHDGHGQTTCYTDTVSLARMQSPEAEMLRIFGMPVNSSVNPPRWTTCKETKVHEIRFLPRIGDIYTFGGSRGFS